MNFDAKNITLWQCLAVPHSSYHHGK